MKKTESGARKYERTSYRMRAAAMRAVLVDERGERVGAHQGNVAGEHEQCRSAARECVARGGDRVACAALFGLQDEADTRVAEFSAHGFFDRLRLMPDDDVDVARL